MLRETIESSIAALDRSRNAQARQNAEKNLTAALMSLERCIQNLKKILSGLDAFQASEIARNPVLTEDARSELLDRISKCGKAVYQSDSHAVDLTKEDVVYLEQSVKEIKSEFDRVWKSDGQAFLEGPAGYLAIIRGLMDDPARARVLEQAALEAIKGEPDRKSVADMEEYVGEMRKLAERFPLDHHVEIFLKKVSDRQATLEDVSPEIAAWLDRNRLKKKIRVSF